MRLLVAALLVMLNCSWAYAAKGSIMASPNPCTIQSGQSTCTETITWSSDTALAQVYVVDPATGTRQLFWFRKSRISGRDLGFIAAKHGTSRQFDCTE